MSAFSDWNGPGHGHGASLPQIATLEELIARIGVLTTDIAAVRTALSSHAGLAATSANGLHEVVLRANEAANNAKTAIDNIINGNSATPFTAASTVKSAVEAISTDINTIKSWLNGYQSSNAISTGIKDINDKIGPGFDPSFGNTVAEKIKAAYDNAESLKGVGYSGQTLKDIFDQLQDYVSSLQADTQTLKVALKTVQDIEVGKIALSTLVDYKKWDLKAPPLRSVNNRNYSTIILGYLTHEYFTSQGTPPTANLVHKPAIAFVKYGNDEPINIIADMTATKKGTSYSDLEWTGSLAASVSKTEDRKQYTQGTVTMPPVRLGLYVGSLSSGGPTRIYLGIVLKESSNYDYGTADSWASGIQQFYTAGINWSPIDAANLPNGAVREICHVDAYNDGEFSVTNLNAQLIRTDSLVAGDGTNIWVEEPDPQHPGQIIVSFGDLTKHLNLQSKDRPSVEHSDLSRHDIAYLSDVANSIYWQRDVVLIADDLTTIKTYLVTVADSAPTVPVTWQPSPTSGFSNVPGIYTSDKTGPVPSGIVFKTNDVALLKDSGSTQYEADGKFNGTFVEGDSYNADLLTNIDKSVIKVASATIPTPADGTTFIDETGKYYTVSSYNPATNVFQGKLITDTQLYPYTVPEYATFDGTTWVDGNLIPVPSTFDGYIHDITYEWSGRHLQNSGWFVESYITWTAHYENHTSMKYILAPWSYTDLIMEGYRTIDRQDIIDRDILTIGATSSDYSEVVSTIEVKLPEMATSVTIDNPAYIHHKPWTGIAVVDGGSFLSPDFYHEWLVDGGDFTGMGGAVIPGIPGIASDRQFRNALVRSMHGLYTNPMPEMIDTGSAIVKRTATDPAWGNFKFVYRWLDDLHMLWQSDGVDLWGFVPLQAMPYKSFVQEYSWDAQVSQLSVIRNLYDWSDPDPRNWKANTLTDTIFSDQVEIKGVDYWTLTFTTVTGGYRIESPRLVKDEADIATLQDDLDQAEQDIDTIETTLYTATDGVVDRLATVITTVGDSGSGLVMDVLTLQNEVERPLTGLLERTTAIENDLNTVSTGLKARVTDLETTVGNSSSGLIQQVNNNTTDIGALETTVGDGTSGLVKQVADDEAAFNTLNNIVTTAGTGLVDQVADLTTDISTLDGRVPAPPAGDGTYTLQVDVVGGVATFSWV